MPEVSTTYDFQNSFTLTQLLPDFYYISGPMGNIAVFIKGVNDEFPVLYYTLTDHLGSIVAITDADGEIIEEQRYDPWGNYRNPLTGEPEETPQLTMLYRGYTGHEMLPEFGLINMNGRLYDPVIARVLSPDNYVQNPYNPQNYNRYSYVLNNPLKYTDPSGEIPVLIPIVAFAVVGAYIGGSTANAGELNPVDWNWRSGDTWAGIGIGAAIGAAGGYGFAVGAPALAGTGFFSYFGASGTVAAYSITGTVVGGAVGYGAGFSGGMLYSNGDWNHAHQSGVYGGQIGSAAGSVIGLTLGMAEGIKPYYKSELENYEVVRQNDPMGCKEATCESIDKLNGGSRTQDDFRRMGNEYLMSNPDATPEQYYENFGFNVQDPSSWSYQQIGRGMGLGHPTVIHERISATQQHTLTIVKIRQWREGGPIKVWFGDPARGRWKADYNILYDPNFNTGAYLFYLH